MRLSLQSLFFLFVVSLSCAVASASVASDAQLLFVDHSLRLAETSLSSPLKKNTSKVKVKPIQKTSKLLNNDTRRVRKNRQKKLRKTISIKVSKFADMPVSELRKNAAKCTLIPSSWVFVTGVNSSYSDFQRALIDLSKDNSVEIDRALSRVNEGVNLKKLTFFSYLSIPAKYRNILQTIFKNQISNNNNKSNCQPAVRPARVFVVPKNMSILQLMHELGSRQKESYPLLANYLAELNPSIRPDNLIKKGELILLPQSYPFSSLKVRGVPVSLPKLESEDASETFTEKSRKKNEEDKGGFFWSIGYNLLSTKIEGQDDISGGTFSLVSESGSSNIIEIGQDFNYSAGVFSLFVVYSQEKMDYKNTSSSKLQGTSTSGAFYSLGTYYRDNTSRLGYGLKINTASFEDIERVNTTTGKVITSNARIIELFGDYSTRFSILGVQPGFTLGANMPFGSDKLTGKVAFDLEAHADLDFSGDFFLRFRLGVNNLSYKKDDRSFTESLIFTGISIYGY